MLRLGVSVADSVSPNFKKATGIDWAGLGCSRSLEKFGAMVTAEAAGKWKQDFWLNH